MTTVAAAVTEGFLFAHMQVFGSILVSLLIFGALITGQAPFGDAD